MGLLLRGEGASRWAAEEFGGARLGNRLRTARLQRVAAGVALAPHGKLTQVFATGEEQQQAYRFVENRKVHPVAVGQAAWRACAARALQHSVLVVPADQSTLTLADPHRTRGTGRTGTRRSKGRGLEVMTALGVTLAGEVQGVLAQAYWRRPETVLPKKAYDSRGLEAKETRFWVKVLLRAVRELEEAAPHTRAWFQADRGADFWELLTLADSLREKHWVTVRAAQDRCVLAPEEGHLWRAAEAAPVALRYSIEVPGRHGHPARHAHLEVRHTPVLVQLQDKRTGRKGAAVFNAVLVREVGRTRKYSTSRGRLADKLEWLLLTTRPIESPQDAKEVVDAYCLRWRCEDFHRAWKGGCCRVEDTQLHHQRPILIWASILASVAARAEALKNRCREAPDNPATELLSVEELRAALLLSKAADFSEEAARALTLLEAAILIGKLGGWSGYYSGQPPGTQVLMRGLERVGIVAQALSLYESSRLQKPG